MLRQDSIIGSSFPLFQSASGKIFLVFAEEAEAEKVLKLIAEQSPAVRIEQTMEALRAELEKVGQTGLAYDYEEVFKGVRWIAVPIFDYQNKLAATLSVSAPTVRLNASSIVKIEKNIIQASVKISLRLGATPARLPFEEKIV